MDALDEFIAREFSAPGRAEGTLSSALSELNPALITQGLEATATLTPEEAAQSRKSLLMARREMARMRRQGRRAAGSLERSGLPSDDLRDAVSQAGTRREPESPSTVGKLFEYLDYPGRAVRALTTPGGGAFDWEEAKDPSEWNRRIEEAAARGETAPQAVEALKGLVGKSVGSLVGAGMAVPGLVSDLAVGRTEGLGARALSTIEEGQKDTGRFAATIAADPLMYFGPGLAKGAGKLALRGAEAIPSARRLARAAVGVGENVPLAEGLAKRAALKTAGRQARGVRAMGIEGELAGRSFATPEAAEAAIKSAQDTWGRNAKDFLGKKIEEITGASGAEAPPFARQIVDRAFDSSSESLSNFLRSRNHPNFARAAELYEQAQALIKKNVLGRSPAHHAVNVANDSIQMFLGGLSNPARLGQAFRLLHGSGSVKIGGQVIEASAFREMLAKEGIELAGGLERIGLTPSEIAAQAAGQGAKLTPGRAAREALTGDILERAPGYLPINAKFGANWEQLSKATLFLDQLAKGRTPAEAAAHTFTYLLDYRDNSKLLQVLRWFVPFVGWYWKAPQMAARALMEHPGRVLGIERAAHELGGAPQVDEPGYRAEQGTNVPLTPRGEEITQQLASLFGGTGARSGQQWLRTRSPVPEALQTAAGALSLGSLGSPAAATSLGGPLPQAFLAALGTNPLTGEPTGEQGFGEALKALAYQTPSLVLPRPAQALANWGLSELAGPAIGPTPLSPFSFPSGDPGMDRLRDLLRSGGANIYTVTPQARVQEILRKQGPRAEKAISTIRGAEKRLAKRRSPKEEE